MAFAIKCSLDTEDKLKILSEDSKYDLSCACATRKNEHRVRSKDNTWIYPVVLPNGGYRYLFKTLLSNICVNDCIYCPLRSGLAARPCNIHPEELAKTFIDYYNAGMVSGLFLSSAVIHTPDSTMESINATASILRRMQFKGYIHLKIIPGASESAIRQTLSLATAVSLNIEAPGEKSFRRLTATKDFSNDILRPIQLISRLTAKGAPFAGVRQTTQFVVGAAGETDREIIQSSWNLYKKLGLSRIYFSAYQRDAVASGRTYEPSRASNQNLLTREHRLYQTDWLIRKYGFAQEEIPLEKDGNLSLEIDPKELWARRHPDFFPVNLNTDDRLRLLRVPGFGEIMVDRIMDLRGKGVRIRSIAELGWQSKLHKKARSYITF